jgi:hypothetical protein
MQISMTSKVGKRLLGGHAALPMRRWITGRLAGILGISWWRECLHHQAVRQMAPDYAPAYSPDGWSRGWTPIIPLGWLCSGTPNG